MPIRYTTSTEEFVIDGLDLTGYEVIVSLSQDLVELEGKASSVTYDGNSTHVFLPLTQEQSAMFYEGDVYAQINWVTPDGIRDATLKTKVEWYDNLLDRVMTYGQ